MKKVLLIFVSFFLFVNIHALESLEINSNNAILYNLNDNSVIYEKNSSEVVQIASLTKIVTAITVIENVENLNEEVTITYKMLQGLDGYAKVGFNIGDKITYLDLLYALMLPSAADAAQALAISTSGSVEEFANLMNTEIKKIGVTDSKFDNPVGMDSENNYSTASDLAKILIYSLENETFETIFNSNYYEIDRINKKVEKTLITTSQLYNIDSSIIKGAKTGFTYGAGMCLASTTTIEGVNYLLITLGADVNTVNNLIDTINIYEHYSNNYGYINILSKGQLLNTIKVKNSKIKAYDIFSRDDIDLYLEKTVKKENLEYKYNGIDELNKDIKKGDKLGNVEVINKGKVIYSYDVYLEQKIKYYNYPLYICIGIGILLIIIFLIKRKNVK